MERQEFDDWSEAIAFYMDSIDDREVERLICRALRPGQTWMDWTDANTINLQFELRNEIEALAKGLPDLDECMDVYGDELFETAEELYARYAEMKGGADD